MENPLVLPEEHCCLPMLLPATCSGMDLEQLSSQLSSKPPLSVTTIIKTTTICHDHHQNHHHLSRLSSKPPPSVTTICHDYHHNHHHHHLSHHNHHHLYMSQPPSSSSISTNNNTNSPVDFTPNIVNPNHNTPQGVTSGINLTQDLLPLTLRLPPFSFLWT